MAQTNGVVAEQDLQGLIQQMTLDEKISMLAGKSVWETANIDRLGIPSLKVSDGPNGARGGDFFDGTTAACFPACVSLAATFNRNLSRQVGKALGQEAITKGAYVLLGPTVCTHRSPLGGRNFEAFSEDPYLSGALAIEYVKGLQEERVGATVKHFLANEQDTRRFSVNETISERALREIYLRPFEMVAKEADPWCFMSSYPKINGKNVDAQTKFLIDILRKQWGYEGLVMSDWGASSSVEGIKYGLDLEMPGPTRFRTADLVKEALKDGRISESDIAARAENVLKLVKKTGKFDDRKDVPNDKEQAINRPEHQALIREAGSEGLVLLKNDKKILPLDTSKLKKIALLGPLAKYSAAHGGGSASLNCHYKVSPYDAFTQRLGDQVEITHSKGAHIYRVYPDMQAGCTNTKGNPGFIGEYFMTPTAEGKPFHIEEYPRGYLATLMNTRVVGSKTVRFSTSFKPTVTGNHYLSFSGLGPAKLYINDELLADQSEPTKDSMAFFLGTQEEIRLQYFFNEGHEYKIRIETHPSPYSNSELYLLDDQLSTHIGIILQSEMEQNVLAEAVDLAKEADLAICFVGNTTQWETEGQDLSTMALPADGSQDRLIASVAAVNTNTIVVNTTGVPVELPWIDSVSAILQAWYAGQETGNAILDVLLGETCPSGKLPISWPKKYEHTGCYGNFGLDSFESREVEYVEGVYVGYRWFDKYWGQEKEVRFPFGYGLSYTTFEVSETKVTGALSGDQRAKVKVSVTVKNTGPTFGAETVQVYLEPPVTEGVDKPLKGLVGFEKAHLQPGEERNIEIEFSRAEAAYWDDTAEKWKVDSGAYKVLVATSSAPKDVKECVELLITDAFSYDP